MTKKILDNSFFLKKLLNFSYYIFYLFVLLIFFEVIVRILVFFPTNSDVFKYGFKKSVIFDVVDLSRLQIVVFDKKKNVKKGIIGQIHPISGTNSVINIPHTFSHDGKKHTITLVKNNYNKSVVFNNRAFRLEKVVGGVGLDITITSAKSWFNSFLSAKSKSSVNSNEIPLSEATVVPFLITGSPN